MKLVFDESKVTWSDLAEMEEGRTSRQGIFFYAKFVVNDDGTPAERAEALRFVGGFNIPTVRETNRKFQEWARQLRESAVNPPTAAS